MGEGWEGKNRRLHDDLCDNKWNGDRKEWIKNQICIAVKGTKAKQVMMWTIMTIMLTATLGSAWRTVSSAQDATEIHARNTADIAHNKQDISEIKQAHKDLLVDVEEIKKNQTEIHGDVQKILGILQNGR